MAEMTPASQQLMTLLEQLALKVVMLEEDDVQGLGSFLSQLEELQGQVSQFQELAPLFKDLNEVGQRLVLREVETVAQGLEVLNQGITLLQKWHRDQQWPPAGEAWDHYRHLLQEIGLDQAGADAEPPAASAGTPVPQIWDDPELVANFLPEAQEHLEGIETHLVFLEQHPDDLEAINAIFRPFHTLKGVAGFFNLTQMQELSHEVEWLLDRVRDGQVVVSVELVSLVLEAVDLLKAMLADIQESLATGRALAAFELAPIKAKIAQVDATSSAPVTRLGEILVAQEDLTPVDLSLALERQKSMEAAPPLGEILVQEGKVPPRKVAEALVKQMTTSKAPTDSSVPDTVKVGISKVDNLVDLMGELVIVQSQVRQNGKIGALADQKLERDLGQMARITSELQKISMSMRMVPIGTTFRKMVRLVRDLSQRWGKKSIFVWKGRTPRSTAAWWKPSTTPWCIWCATPWTTASRPPPHVRRPASPPWASCPSGRSTRAETSSSKSRTTAGASTGRPSWPRPWSGAWCRRARPSALKESITSFSNPASARPPPSPKFPAGA